MKIISILNALISRYGDCVVIHLLIVQALD